MQDFRQLQVWRKAHQLALSAYKATRPFPSEERYGLISQIRRASVSIAANITEGCGRKSDADFARFLQMAMGSASEVEYLVLLAHDLEFMDDDRHRGLTQDITEVKRMLTSFLRKLRADS